jgi:hypothetical protein
METESRGGIEQISVAVLPDGRMDRPNTAKYLGLAEPTLAVWATKGFGPRSFRVGGRAFYWKAEVDAFIRAGAEAA